MVKLIPQDSENSNYKAIDSTHTLQLDDESYRDDAFDPASAKSEEATVHDKTKDAVSRSNTKQDGQLSDIDDPINDESIPFVDAQSKDQIEESVQSEHASIAEELDKELTIPTEEVLEEIVLSEKPVVIVKKAQSSGINDSTLLK